MWVVMITIHNEFVYEFSNERGWFSVELCAKGYTLDGLMRHGYLVTHDREGYECGSADLFHSTDVERALVLKVIVRHLLNKLL
jgi:hypothetical protein